MKLESHAHYPYSTRMLIDLINADELPMIVDAHVEPTYGHVGRLVYADGRVRLFRNSNRGINNNGASAISRDKGYTKYFLRRLGYEVPDGETFLADDYAALIDTHLGQHGFDQYATPQKVLGYIEALGYPVVIKPNDESLGKGVFVCYDESNVTEAIQALRGLAVRVFLVEEYIGYPDYRVVVFDGAVRMAYRRFPLQIVGDGLQTIGALLDTERARLDSGHRRVLFAENDARLNKRLHHFGLTRGTVLPADEVYIVYDAANASLGGQIEDVTEVLHPYWQQLCIDVSRAMGLRLCGVDLACADIASPDAPYAIFELNASPGLSHYAASGEIQAHKVRQLVKDIYRFSE